MSNSSNLISQIYNSRLILLEQMDYQGYDTEQYKYFTINEVNSMKKNNQMDMILEKYKETPATNKKNKIYIKYYLGKLLRPNNIQEMIDEIFNLEEILTKEDTLYLIVKEELNETMTEYLKYIYDENGIFIIIQMLERLQFNVLNHELVPPHRILNIEEIDIIKKRYNITDNNNFPQISRFDAVSLAIGIRPNEICEIKRPSKTSITTLYYRICKN